MWQMNNKEKMMSINIILNTKVEYIAEMSGGGATKFVEHIFFLVRECLG
jgi:hypothetical protein